VRELKTAVFIYRKRIEMLKWAKARIDRLTLGKASPVAGGDALPASIISAAAERVSRRLVALSSSGFDSPTAREIIVAIRPQADRTPANPRRPGMQARWKEQNRVPFHNMTT
jgi:hypothetical protein